MAVTLRPNETNILYNAVCALATLGKKEEAIQMMERVVNSGLSNVDWWMRDPDLHPLRDDPRFQRLMELTRRKAQSA